jgi:hypothetical protein
MEVNTKIDIAAGRSLIQLSNLRHIHTFSHGFGLIPFARIERGGIETARLAFPGTEDQGRFVAPRLRVTTSPPPSPPP